MAAIDELVRLSRIIPDWSWSKAAIISRDWRKLAPVRDFAEALSIPVEVANEQLPGLWGMREMQAFVEMLRHEERWRRSSVGEKKTVTRHFTIHCDVTRGRLSYQS